MEAVMNIIPYYLQTLKFMMPMVIYCRQLMNMVAKRSTALYSPYESIFNTGVAFNNQLGITAASNNGSVYFSIGHLNSRWGDQRKFKL